MPDIYSFPNNQDEYTGAEHVMRWHHGRTSGVFGAANNAAVAPVADSMAVTVSDGLGWLSNAEGNGIVWWNQEESTTGAKLTLPVATADGTLSRIDRVVVSWQTTNYVARPTIEVLKGAISSTPAPPALTNNASLRQISLAQISIPAGTTEITPSLVTDERLDASVCGLVTESINIDTSTMQNQFSTLLATIQLELKNLNAGTAALLKTGDTMQGTLDMGDNKIQNVAAPENENDAVNKKFIDDAFANFESGMSMELLWENASPTSNFNPQTISVDLTDCNFIAIEFAFSSSTTYEKQRLFIFKKTTNDTNTYQLVLYGESSFYSVTRRFTTTNTSVVFKEGKSGTSVSNSHAIPLAVYSIKGVV